MNRLFDEPLAVFNKQMLKPELQGMEDYVDGINNIVEAHKKVALAYFEDESVDSAIPPLTTVVLPNPAEADINISFCFSPSFNLLKRPKR